MFPSLVAFLKNRGCVTIIGLDFILQEFWGFV